MEILIHIVPLLFSSATAPLDHQLIQTLFGMHMTLLIAMESMHSIIRVALRRSSIVKAKTVVRSDRVTVFE